MPKLAALKALKLVSVKKTTLYNAMGCRHGSNHYRRSRSRNHGHRTPRNAAMVCYQCPPETEITRKSE